jgi:hypothetical protein
MSLDMANSKQVGFRWPIEMIERLDAYAVQQRKKTGMNMSRAQAAFQLVEQGLEGAGFPAAKPKDTARESKAPKKGKAKP